MFEKQVKVDYLTSHRDRGCILFCVHKYISVRPSETCWRLREGAGRRSCRFLNTSSAHGNSWVSVLVLTSTSKYRLSVVNLTERVPSRPSYHDDDDDIILRIIRLLSFAPLSKG
jgi:hypothetical protein